MNYVTISRSPAYAVLQSQVIDGSATAAVRAIDLALVGSRTIRRVRGTCELHRGPPTHIATHNQVAGYYSISRHRSIIGSETEGIVVALHVREGESVAKGASIAELRTDALEQRLNAAQSQLDATRASRELASRSLDRARPWIGSINHLFRNSGEYQRLQTDPFT